MSRQRRMSKALFVFAAAALIGADVQAQAPHAAAPPTPPVAAGADKSTSDALAQEAEVKPKEPEDEKDKKYRPLTGHFSAGYTLTSGNSNTRSFNVGLLMKYDPRTGNVVKADGFYILSTESGASTVDRTSAHLRDEYYFRPRWFAYGDVQYLKDQFKEIDYLIAPTAGVGTVLVKTKAQELLVDLGAGALFEKDQPVGERTDSAVVRAGENYSWKVSDSASFTETSFALWKTKDFADAYYHLDVGLAAAINDHFELKIALIDEYKRKPPDPTVKRNDVAGIVAIGYKL